MQTVLNGKPTKPFVDKIMDRVRLMKAGDVLSHIELEVVVGEDRKSDRYRSVIGAVKRVLLRELSIDLLSVRGTGYQIPTGFEQVRSGVGRVRSGCRRIARGVKVVAVVDDKRLASQAERSARDHVLMTARHLQAISASQKKTLDVTIGKPGMLPLNRAAV